MVATSLDGVLLYGVAASRPAASAVAKGTLYSATDTGVVSQSDGVSTWSTFLSVSATGIPATILDVKGDLIAATAADTVARLAAGANGTYLEAASGETTGLKWGSRILRGTVSSAGAVTNGTGFTVSSHPSTGNYVLAFTASFTAGPVLVVSAYEDKRIASVAGGTLSTSGATILISTDGGTLEDRAFFFIAMEP